MDSCSVYTDFEFPDHITVGSSSASKLNVGKKLENRKFLRRSLKSSENEILELKQQLERRNAEIVDLKESVKSLNEIISLTSKSSQNHMEISNNVGNQIDDPCRSDEKLKAELVKSKVNEKLEKDMHDCPITDNFKYKKPNCCHYAVSIEDLQDKLGRTKQKLFEALNINTELKNSLRLAQKCLHQEIGESFNLNTITNSKTNWRGRAQQIITLQHKVTELKERLEVYDSNASLCHLEKLLQTPICKSMEKNRKAELEDLQNQIKKMHETITQQASKISALKARNKNLVDDAMNYKLKSLNLMEQFDISGNSIVAINEKLNIQKYNFELEIRQLQNQLTESRRKIANAEIEHQRTHLKVDEAHSVVKEKDNEIASLKELIQMQQKQIKSICGDFLFSCRDLKKSEYLAILGALESEKNNLLKLIEKSNKRLELHEENEKNQAELISKQKIKISRLEAKIRDQNIEINDQMEKKKRNQRIAHYSQQNVCNRLSVSGIIFENSSTGLYPKSGRDTQPNQLNSLQDKINFLNDKIEYLEEKVIILQNEKKTDLQEFKNIMENSKEVLLQTIKSESMNKLCNVISNTENRPCCLSNNKIVVNLSSSGENKYEKEDLDKDSLENYHINLDYCGDESVTNGFVE